MTTICATKAVTVKAGIDFPHAAQAIQITRRTRPAIGSRRWRTEVASARDLGTRQPAPAVT